MLASSSLLALRSYLFCWNCFCIECVLISYFRMTLCTSNWVYFCISIMHCMSVLRSEFSFCSCLNLLFTRTFRLRNWLTICWFVSILEVSEKQVSSIFDSKFLDHLEILVMSDFLLICYDAPRCFPEAVLFLILDLELGGLWLCNGLSWELCSVIEPF